MTKGECERFRVQRREGKDLLPIVATRGAASPISKSAMMPNAVAWT
jgi:hypothetical protein